jgi:hypothetical protein
MEIKINPLSKSYKTEDRARQAILKLEEKLQLTEKIRFVIIPQGNRFHPVAVGTDYIWMVHENFQVIA